jgi:hypothetical protein
MTPARQPPYEMQDAYILTKEKWIELCEHLTIGCTNQKAFLDSLAAHTSAPAPEPDYRELFIRDLLYNFRWTAEHGNPEFFKAVDMIKREYLKPESELLAAHDAQVAKAAREQVLKELRENTFDPDDEDNIIVDKILEKLESIRQQEPRPHPPSPSQEREETQPFAAWLQQHDAAIVRAATLAALEELKQDLKTRFVSSTNSWSNGRNSGLIECCNIIDEHADPLRQSTTAAKQEPRP